MIDVVVLLGPPGSGKSTIGEALGSLGFRCRDWEADLLAEWGSREAFIANKVTALPAFHERVLAAIAEPGLAVVFETTGLSDAPFLQRLAEERAPLFVRLELPEAVAIDRIVARERGRHLSDQLEPNRRIWEAYTQNVLPAWRHASVVIDTVAVGPTAAAGLIAAAIERNG